MAGARPDGTYSRHRDYSADQHLWFWGVWRGRLMHRKELDCQAEDLKAEFLQGHMGAINDVAFSPDGRYLASASDDGTIGLWDVYQARLRCRLHAGADPAVSVVFRPDGRSLVSLQESDDIVRLWRF